MLTKGLVTTVCIVTLGVFMSGVSANEVTIGSGSVMSLGGNAFVTSCDDIFVSTGGTLDFGGGGSMTGCRHFTIENGATVTGTSGTLTISGTWTNNGDYSVGSLSFDFIDGCGASHVVQGSSDTDNDGFIDDYESAFDSDNDGIYNFLDADSYEIPAADELGFLLFAFLIGSTGIYLLRRRRMFGEYY